ncbi:unnamed protein product [Prunus armeniaca]
MDPGSESWILCDDNCIEFAFPVSADICCHCSSTDGLLASWSPRGPRRLRHWLHQWCSLLAPGGITGPPAPLTPHRPMLLVRRGHNQVTNSRINIGYDKRHRVALTAELHSSLAHDVGHAVRTHCPMQWKSWKVMPDEIKTEVREQLLTNYNLEDLDDESLAYVNKATCTTILRCLMIRKSLFRRVARRSLRAGR